MTFLTMFLNDGKHVAIECHRFSYCGDASPGAEARQCQQKAHSPTSAQTLPKTGNGCQQSATGDKKSRALVGRPAEEHPQTARRIPFVVVEELMEPEGRRAPGRRSPNL